MKHLLFSLLLLWCAGNTVPAQEGGSPVPSQGRKSFSIFKFFRADSPLLPSGLFGPVELQVQTKL